MRSIRYYNDHYLYIRCGVATEEQLSYSLEKCIRRLKNPCNYKINLVMITDKITRKELYSGYAYIWLSNLEISYALTNRSYDGQERFRLDQDGERVNLKPLLSLPGYNYTETQKQHLKQICYNHQELPEKGYFEVDRAWVSSSSYDVISSKLVGTNIPFWITEDYLYKQFKRYSSYKNFPKVRIETRIYGLVKKRICFINFMNDSTDGKFAIMMTKRHKFIDRSNPDNIALVYFNFFSPS